MDNFFSTISKILDKKKELLFNDFNIEVNELHLQTISNQIHKQCFEAEAIINQTHSRIPEIPLLRKNKDYHPIEEISFKRSNGNEVKIGGEIVPPYINYFSDEEDPTTRLKNPNPPAITYDVFDMKISLPKVIKNEYLEVLDDPAGWAELAVKYGADLITLHFVSTDPGVLDSSVSNAANVLDEVLQRVDVPVIIGGSGNKKKDTELFEVLGANTEGERLMLSSADKITFDKVVPIAKKFGHNVLLWGQLDLNDQTKLVEDALAMGMPRNRIILDPTCATLGYGLEYSYSIFQRVRLAGLNGNTSLNFPISGGTTNAWGARESWMKSLARMPQNGGDRMLRGPLWEAITAFTMSLVGLDLAMMLHPYSARLFKEILADIYKENINILPTRENDENPYEWVSSEF